MRTGRMAWKTEREATRSPRFITLLFFVQLPYRDQAPPLRQRCKNPRPCAVINMHNGNSRSIEKWLFVKLTPRITLTHLQPLSKATIKTSGPNAKPWGTPRSSIIMLMIMVIKNSGLMQLIVFISLLSSCRRLFGCFGGFVPL